MRRTFTQADLDKHGCQGCNNPDHDHSELFVQSRCHPNAGCHVVYSKREGTLQIFCRSCDMPIFDVKVARE